MIFLIYVDDTIFFAPEQSQIEHMITDLKKYFDLADEGDIDAFLGEKKITTTIVLLNYHNQDSFNK